MRPPIAYFSHIFHIGSKMPGHGSVKSAQTIVGDAQIAIGVVDCRANKRSAERKSVILLSVVEIIVIIVVGACSFALHRRSGKVARCPVYRSALVHQVDIFYHGTIDYALP